MKKSTHQNPLRTTTSTSQHNIQIHNNKTDKNNNKTNGFHPNMMSTIPKGESTRQNNNNNNNTTTNNNNNNNSNNSNNNSNNSNSNRNHNKPISIEDELDALTDILTLTLQNTDQPGFLGVCCKCRKPISGRSGGGGCEAMGETYHAQCFTCSRCPKQLSGQNFFNVNNTPFCETCYETSLEKCVVCKERITDAIIKAVGNPYHARCFKCVGCEKNLDGVPFSMDVECSIYCVQCFQLRFSPRCCVCHDLIMPTFEQKGTIHIVSMDKNFHVECYKCEDCGESLFNEEDRGCYPMDGKLLCQRCHLVRASTKQRNSRASVLSTEL